MISIIIDNTVEVKVTGKKLSYYLNKGYNCKVGDLIHVNIKDLTSGSNIKINCLCDYCLEDGVNTPFKKAYYNIVKQTEVIDKLACKKCGIKKKEDVQMELYGVPCYQKRPDYDFSQRKERSDKFSMEEMSNIFLQRGCLLLNDNYENYYSDLYYICMNHESYGVQKTNLKNFKKSVYICKGCFSERCSENNLKYSSEEIKELISNKNIDIITNVFYGTNDIVEFVCPNHPEKGIQTTTVYNLIAKEHSTGCWDCGVEYRSDLSRLTIEEVKRAFNDKGLKLIDNEYINTTTPLKYKCLKHPEDIQESTVVSVKSNKYICKHCYYESRVGENHWNWKGGISSLQKRLRDELKEWKKESMKLSNYKCVITGDKFHDIHHLYPFNKILYDTLEDLEIEIKSRYTDYTSDQIKLIKEKFNELHNSHPLGVCLRGDVHKLFHRHYGDDFLVGAFYTFKDDFLSGKYDEEIKNIQTD